MGNNSDMSLRCLGCVQSLYDPVCSNKTTADVYKTPLVMLYNTTNPRIMNYIIEISKRHADVKNTKHVTK